MAPSISFLWRGATRLFLLLALTTGNSEGALLRHKENEVFPQKTVNQDSSDENLEINLPLIFDMAIEFCFAINWRHDLAFCNAKENGLLAKCGLSDLIKRIQVRSKEQKEKRDMETALNSLCSAHDQFKQCLEENGLPNCGNADGVIIDLLLPYLCGPGKQKLLESYTGMCLSNKANAARVEDVVTQLEDCENSLSDWHSGFTMLLSQMRFVSQFDKLAVQEHLKLLCNSWNKLEKCVFPAYGKVCGSTAKTFYSDLLNKIKKELAGVLAGYGRNVSQQATCKQVGSPMLPQAMVSPFEEFIDKQLQFWRSTMNHTNPCDIKFSFNRMIMCFWESAKSAGPKFEEIMLQDMACEKCCSLFNTFSTCYDVFMNSCPSDVKLNFNDLTEKLCEIVGNEVNSKTMQMILKDCGYSVSQLGVYFWYQATNNFDVMINSCSDTFSTFDLDFECLHEKADATSISEAVKEVQSFINSIKKLMTDYNAFMRKLKPLMC